MDGRYIYVGEYVSFQGTDREKKTLDIKALISAVLALLSLAGGICTLAGDMAAKLYIVIPLILEVIFGFFLIWYTIEYLKGGNPMKEHVYKKIAGKLPVFGLFMAIFSGVGLILSLVFLLTEGLSGVSAYNAAYTAAKLITTIVGIFFFICMKR